MVKMENTNDLVKLKGLGLGHGQILIGEFRGIEMNESNGKQYFKVKVLVGDFVKKLDVNKPELRAPITNYEIGKAVGVRYYEFTGRFGVNLVATAVAALQ